MRAVLLPIWNAYGFFASYANIDGINPTALKAAPPVQERNEIDRWILALLHKTEINFHKHMEAYNLAEVAPELSRFIDNLTNWYIRLNRQRFWAGKDEIAASDKLAAYATLFEVLSRFAQLIAPNLPFFAESLFASLQHGIKPKDLASQGAQSVHETLYQVPGELSQPNVALVIQMQIAQRAILLGRSLRSDAKIGLRQPLAKISLAGLTADESKNLLAFEALVKQELNIKGITLLSDGSALVVENVKPNLARLGKRMGKKVPTITAQLKSWGSKEILAFEAKGFAEIEGERLERDDLIIERKATEGKCAGALEGLVGELDTLLTPELLREGLMRELVNRIQQMRKTNKFHLKT
jgi:isoleucyl-tRNA synthetase